MSSAPEVLVRDVDDLTVGDEDVLRAVLHAHLGALLVSGFRAVLRHRRVRQSAHRITDLRQ